MVKEKDKRPQVDLLEVHCLCICGGDALLGDVGVSKPVEREAVFVFSYPRFLLSVFFLCLLVVLVLLSVLTK